jgi:hypothetical protein
MTIRWDDYEQWVWRVMITAVTAGITVGVVFFIYTIMKALIGG